MSKRHHVQRRKAYGRRRHELRERESRRALSQFRGWDDVNADSTSVDAFVIPHGRGGRIRFAAGE
jgi:hypothetical protein